MNDQAKLTIASTVIASWARVPGRNITAPSLEIAFTRHADDMNAETFVEEIHLEPPRAWKPGTVFMGHDIHKLAELKVGSTVVSDSHAMTWEVNQRVTRDSWTLILSNTKPEMALPPDWALSVAILLDKPNADTTGQLVVSIDDVRQNLGFTVPAESENPPWIVRLESDPPETNALVRGQELVLRWEVQNVEGDAELRGSLTGANTMRIANGDQGERTIRALGESVYSLTATVLQDGKLIEIVRRVHVNLEVPQIGLHLEFVPADVFPGGPIVAYRSAYSVKRIKFTRSGDEPSLATYNYVGPETTIVDTFVVPFGPKEGRTWTLGAVYGSPEGEKSIHGNPITGIAPAKVENSKFYHLPVSFGLDEGKQVHALAAGTFLVGLPGPKPQIARREWIAKAMTSGLELWVRDPAVGEVKAVAEMLDGKWKNNWLKEALEGEFLGVAAANDAHNPTQWVVAIRKKGGEGIVEVIEFDFPLRENAPYRSVLTISDRRFAQGTVRIVPCEKRVFLLGDGAAISYPRYVRVPTCQDEPRLAMVAFPEWEIVGITREYGAPETKTTDHLFALEQKSGVLLRFDVQDGIVMPPRMAARGNDKVARLDKLQEAQAYLSPTPPPFPREALEEGRGYTGKDTDGTILEYLNPIDERSSMVAVGGVLVVRSEVVDPSVGQTIQDRAYDPRFDVWARCGHPFANVNPAFFAATQSTLYCLAGDELDYVEGSLPFYLGFVASDYTPIDAQSLAPPPWPEAFTFPTIDNKTSLDVQWVDGRLSPTLFEKGQWRIALLFEGQTIIIIDAEVNRETGSIQTANAIADETGRKVDLCRWSEHTLTIEPMTWSLYINAEKGLVLPFSYHIEADYLDPISGETSTGNAVDISSITGDTLCTLEFKYTAGDARAGALDARVKLVMVNGIVADMQWEGEHAAHFLAEIVDGRILHLALNQ